MHVAAKKCAVFLPLYYQRKTCHLIQMAVFYLKELDRHSNHILKDAHLRLIPGMNDAEKGDYEACFSWLLLFNQRNKPLN